MSTSIALLRGIGGGIRPLPMKEAVAALEGLGLRDVRSYIATGNFVFQSRRSAPRLAREIEACIEERFGFVSRTVVLGAADLERAVRDNPFPSAHEDPTSVHLFFLTRAAEAPRLDEMSRLAAKGEQFVLKEQVLYFHSPEGFGRSKLGPRVERLLGVEATARNFRTARKVLELAKGGLG